MSTITTTTTTKATVPVLVLAAALAVGGTVAASEASAASASSASDHRIVFTAKHTGTVITSKSTYVLTDDDVRKGATIGADVLSCRDTSSTSLCTVSFALRGGQLHGSFSLSHADGSLRGRITGGSVRYAHARGTITGQAVSHSATSVVVSYR